MQGNTQFDNTVQPSPRCCDCKWQWPHNWTLKEAFCGFSVRTGSLLIGWIFLIGCFTKIFLEFVVPTGRTARLHWEHCVLLGLKLISSIVLLVGVYKHHLFLIRASVIISLVDKFVEIVVVCVISANIGHAYPFILMLAFEPITIYSLVIANSLANQMSMGLVKFPSPTV